MLRYREIKKKLVEIISCMQQNEKLPSRPYLCSKLDTTRATLDKAIRELVNEGALTSKKGSGTYVTPQIAPSGTHGSYWGVIVPNVMETIYAGIVRGVENVAQQHNVSVTLCNSDNNAEKQEQYISRLLGSGASGLIIVPVINHNVKENCQLYDQILNANISLVFCNRTLEGISAPIVTSNDYYGAYIGTKHLIERGYRNIGFISQTRYSTSISRCQGYLTALMEQGFDIRRQNIIIEEAYSDEPPGYVSMKKMLEDDTTLDAVFCFNDRLAKGIYQAIEESGKRVSADVGVISYDNSMPLCEQLSPSLSSMSYQNIEVGEMAAEVLWKLVNNHPMSAFNHYIMQPEIVIRESCNGPVKRGGAEPNQRDI